MVAMAHVTCVGHSQAELREVLEELRDRGVQNLMCLRGDPPRGQTNFVPAPDGFAYAYELVTLARSLNDFSIGVAGYPEMHPEVWINTVIWSICEPRSRVAPTLSRRNSFDNRDYFGFCGAQHTA
jgi:methylenetetrahydrofolate reductase (NADPH)